MFHKRVTDFYTLEAEIFYGSIGEYFRVSVNSDIGHVTWDIAVAYT